MPKIPVLGQTYTARSGQVHGDECVNYYTETVTKDLTSIQNPATLQSMPQKDVVLYCTPGLLSRVTITGSSVRGMLSFHGKIYTVVDDKFYELVQDTDGVTLVATLRGTLPAFPVDKMGPVSIISNGLLGNQLLILTGDNKFTFDLTTLAFTAVVDGFGVSTDQATYQDGYGIMINKNTNQWVITDLLDFSNIDALSFASSTTKCDNLIAAATLSQYIFLFGQYGTEVWYNSGSTALDGTEATFPFSRVTQMYIEWGCVAPFSIVRTDSTLYWLSQTERGEGFIVCVGGSNGLTPQVVSSRPINDMISKFTDRSDCIAYGYQDRGHDFVVFIFPTDDTTIVYDITTQLWHTRSSVRETSPGTELIQGRHKSNCYAYLNGIHYVGDYESGKIYQMSTDFLDDDGDIITRRRRSGHLNTEQKRISIRRLELDMTRGAGLVTGQGSDPQIELRVSKDGGYTFVSKGFKSFGELGDYTKRIQWTLLGTSRDWVFEFVVTDPVDHVLIDCFADVETAGT